MSIGEAPGGDDALSESMDPHGVAARFGCELDEIYGYAIEIIEGPLKEIKHLSTNTGVNVRLYIELRDSVTHISRAMRAMREGFGRDCDVDPVAYAFGQLRLARSHLQACELDCYKASCIAYDLLVEDTIDLLVSVCDLSRVDNGDYLRDLRNGQAAARELHIRAKRANAERGRDSIGCFRLATERYRALYRMLKDPDARTRIRINRLIDREKLERRRRAICATGKAVVSLVNPM